MKFLESLLQLIYLAWYFNSRQKTLDLKNSNGDTSIDIVHNELSRAYDINRSQRLMTSFHIHQSDLSKHKLSLMNGKPYSHELCI